MKKRNLIIIKDILQEAVQKAGFEVDPDHLHVERTKTLEHGHFSSNVAMLIAGKLGKRSQEVAQEIVAKINSEIFEKVEIAGPGFINLWVEQKFYTIELASITSELDDYLEDTIGLQKEKTMVIDYSHPNIAKPMGVHHLLSTVIGDSIKKIYRRVGWKVIADNFIGDMGTQFGKLMHAIKEWGNMDEIEKDPINSLLKLYVKFHIEADKDVELDDAGRAEYKKFEEGDPEARKLWKRIVQWSFKEIESIYSYLNIEFDYMKGESFYQDKMQPILDEGRKKGIIVDGEGGAWIIKPDDPKDVPVLLRKSDGTTLYATRDLARIKYWDKEFNPALMVNVVDVAQEFYFRQLFFAQSKLGLTEAKNVHVSFGRMQFKDKQMSTRKGNILFLADLLDEAWDRATELAKEKGVDLDVREINELGRIMGIGAIKYIILSESRTTNITFDWDKMLSFEGNSAPYLMYTAARAKSVLRKSGLNDREISKSDFKPVVEAETELAVQLLMYPDTVQRAAEEFKPNHIANYLYQLAQDFNTFYNGNSVLKAETEELKKSRLLLTASVVQVMEDGLALLGIDVPEKM